MLSSVFVVASLQCGTPAAYESLGTSTSGTNGPAVLSANGMPQTELPLSLRVTGGLASAPGFLLYSATEVGVFVPEIMTTLYPAIPAVLDLFVLDAGGESPPLINAPSLPASLCGAQITAQAAFLDALGPGGLVVTNGLRLMLGDVDVPVNLVPVYAASDQTLYLFQTDGTFLTSEFLGVSGASVAMDRHGALWMAGGSEVSKVRIGIPPYVESSFTTPGQGVGRIAVAPDDTLWMCDNTGDQVVQYDMDGNQLAAFSVTYDETRGVGIAPDAVHPWGYMVWYTSYDNPTAISELVRMDPMTGVKQSRTVSGARLWSFGIATDGSVWIPVGVGGSGSTDRLDHYDTSLNLVGSSSTFGFTGTDMTDAVVAPTGHIFCVAADGDGGANDPTVLFEFDETGSFCGGYHMAPIQANGQPRGVFCDGEGNVWATIGNEDEVYRHDPVTCGSLSGGQHLFSGDNPANRGGDPTGYLQAYLYFPDEDFDGDGVANRAELEAGDNPFVPGS